MVDYLRCQTLSQDGTLTATGPELSQSLPTLWSDDEQAPAQVRLPRVENTWLLSFIVTRLVAVVHVGLYFTRTCMGHRCQSVESIRKKESLVLFVC